ncbi:hypothetical protein F4778DRAFT_799091 [Xylariomycetidae sp. FL2044]|nr:hypothetical protein F4778DRAFT_799091 [Xylariomycetidae sp. FL2044]
MHYWGVHGRWPEKPMTRAEMRQYELEEEVDALRRRPGRAADPESGSDSKDEPLRARRAEHDIILDPKIKPYRLRQRKWTPPEREFAFRIFPQMESALLIGMCISAWGATSQFPPKKDPMQIRVVHDYRPVNSASIKRAHNDGVFRVRPGSSQLISVGSARLQRLIV